MTEREEAVGRIEARIKEIDAHVKHYPSWIGGTTEQHARDLRTVLDALSGYEDGVSRSQSCGDGERPAPTEAELSAEDRMRAALVWIVSARPGWRAAAERALGALEGRT